MNTTKKYDFADLEKTKGLFLQIGFIITISLILVVFEWTTPAPQNTQQGTLVEVDIEFDYLQRSDTKVNAPAPPEPQPDLFEDIEPTYNQTSTQNLRKELDEISYENKQIVEPIQEEEETPPVLLFSDVMPEFPGGMNALQQFVITNTKYPAEAIEKDLQGKVFVRFLVDYTGNVQSAHILRSVHRILDEEAIRIVNTLPRWRPGTHHGKKVSVWFTIPVVFQIV